jgi:hypothetical protein
VQVVDGTRLNPVKLDGFQPTDPVSIGKKLNEIADKARTHGLSEPIGSLYSFTLLVKSETTVKDGFDLVQNRFFIKGEGEILYNYNHGHLATDLKTAAQNFLNALDTMPALLEKYKTDNEKLMKDAPTLKAVVESPWKKEDELKALKAEMTVMERKIEASLKPIEQSVGIMAGVPQEENKFVPMPDNLKNINALLGEQVAIVRPSHGIPEKKGFKI